MELLKFSQLDNLDWEVDSFLSQMQEGNIGVLMPLGEHFGNALKSYSIDLVKDSAVAGQIAAQAFSEVWESRQNIQDASQLVAYLYFEVSKRSITQLALAASGSELPGQSHPADLTELIRIKEWARITRIALSSPTVSPTYRNIAEALISDHTFSSIASKQKVAIGTITQVLTDLLEFFENQSAKITLVSDLVQALLYGSHSSAMIPKESDPGFVRPLRR